MMIGESHLPSHQKSRVQDQHKRCELLREAGNKTKLIREILGNLDSVLELQVGVTVVIHKLHLGTVLSTSHHARGSLKPVVLGDINSLELVLGGVCSQHLGILGNGLTHLGDGVEDLETQNDVVLDTEGNTHLVLASLLDNHRGLLGLLQVVIGFELEGHGGVALSILIVEDNGEFLDDGTTLIVLRKRKRKQNREEKEKRKDGE